MRSPCVDSAIHAGVLYGSVCRIGSRLSEMHNQHPDLEYDVRMPPRRRAESATKSAKKKTAVRASPARKASKTVKAAVPATQARKASKTVKAAGGRRGQRGLSAEHKAQMARGREEARIVRSYLATIDTGPKRPGRRRSPETVAKQIAQVNAQLREARGIERLNLVKQRRDLEAARAGLLPAADRGGLERDFVRVARSYGERRGIDYSMWREVGVPAAVLSKARVPRTRLGTGPG